MMQDDAGLQVFAVPSASALRVTSFVGDTTSPHLWNFGLDVNAGRLTLTFSETMDASTFVQSRLLLQISDNSTAHSFSWTTSTPTTANSQFLTLTIATYELNLIKQNVYLAKTPATTYLSLIPSSISDMNGNMIVGIGSNQSQLVTTYVFDTTAPVLTSFDLNMNSGCLWLTFSETVNSQTFDNTQIGFQVGLVSGQQYFLTGGSHSDIDWTTIQVNLTITDLNRIKQLYPLATSNTTSNMIFGSGLVSDMNIYDASSHVVGVAARLNKVVAIGSGSARAVSVYTADVTSPIFTSCSLDMDANTLTLVFDETVRSSDVRPTFITFQNALTSGASSQTYTLTGGIVSPTDSTVIVISLTPGDQNAIKNLTHLAVSVNTSFIRISGGGVADMVGNLIATSTLQVTAFNADVTKPTLVQYQVNLTTEIITFEFSKTINSSSFNFNGLQFQNSAALPTLWFVLTRGWLVPVTYTTYTLHFDHADLNQIKSMVGLATAVGNTWLQVQAGTVADMSGNALVATTANTASFGPDYVKPVLLSFTLDMNSRVLSLTFSETVMAPSNLTQLSLQSSAAFSLGSGTFTLTSSSSSSTSFLPVVTVGISVADANAIKLIENLAISNTSTFVVITSSFIRDMNLNSVVAVPATGAIATSSYSPDITSPNLVEFSLDLNQGTTGLLIFTFDEPIRYTTVNVSEITIQSQFGSSSLSYTLQGTVSALVGSQRSATTMSIRIDTLDTNVIKSLFPLASSFGATFVSFPASFAKDMSLNKITAINSIF
jgi:hypothetical protein